VTVIDQVQLKERLGNGRAVVVDFHADWCGPCRAIAPELDKLDAQYGEVDFVKVDADANPELVNELGVMGLPTVVHFGTDGVEVARSTGAAPAQALEFRLRLSS
jgi:thioredoxin 1